jgi:hypothetical protein
MVLPNAMDALVGETAIETRAAGVTVRDALPLTPDDAALMFAEPTATLVAMPVLEMVATLVFDEVQVAELVKFLVLPSLYLPVAVNCWPAPAATEGVPGVTWMDCKTAVPPPPEPELPPPQPTSRLTQASAIKIEIWYRFIRVTPSVTLVITAPWFSGVFTF